MCVPYMTYTAWSNHTHQILMTVHTDWSEQVSDSENAQEGPFY